MITKLSELHKIAKAATPGPWTAHDNHGVRYVSNGLDGKFAKFDNRVCEAATNLFLQGEAKYSNMKHIATFNPSLVSRLLEDYSKMVKALECIRGNADVSFGWQHLCSETLSSLSLLDAEGVRGE